MEGVIEREKWHGGLRGRTDRRRARWKGGVERKRMGKEKKKGTMERVDVDVTSRYTGRIHALEMAWVVG